MFLNKKIQASSIAEVVIAVAIIALCIGIAALVFVRSTKVTINFQEVKKQTEIQSEIWEALYKDKEMEEFEDIIVETEEHEEDSLKTIVFKGNDNKIIWKQDWISNDKH